MALTEIKTSGIADDAVTTDKLANAINTERTANTAKPTLANDANNRVVTGDGSGGLNGEANLTFDGTTLDVAGDIRAISTAFDPDNGAFDAANYPLIVQNPHDENGDSTGIGFGFIVVVVVYSELSAISSINTWPSVNALLSPSQAIGCFKTSIASKTI